MLEATQKKDAARPRVHKPETIAKIFDRQLSVICNGCEYLADEVTVPKMTADEKDAAIKRLQMVRKIMLQLMKRIETNAPKEVANGPGPI